MTVTVCLAGKLWRQLAPDPAAVAETVTSALGDLTGALWAEVPAVRIEPAGQDDADLPVSVHAEGRPLPYPAECLWQAIAYVRSAVPTPLGAEELSAGLDGMSEAELGEVVALVCHEAVGQGDASPGPSLATGGRPSVELCLGPEQFSSLLIDDPEGKGFATLREQILEDLGMPLPDLRLRPDRSLRPGGYVFRVNGVRSVPRIGLAADQLLIMGTAGEPGNDGADPVPAAYPGTWWQASIVPRASLELLEQAGISTWKPHEYLQADLDATIRQQAAAFMTAEVAERMMNGLADVYPAVGQAARDLLSPDLLATVLRDLLSDGIPVRNLRRITELCLRYQHGQADPAVGLVGRVRAGMADAIARSASGGSETIAVLLLDDQTERAIAALDPVHPAETGWPLGARLRAAVRAELAQLPLARWPPVLLTSDDARLSAHRLLTAAFPQMAVVSYSDLPGNADVQPVTRISATERDHVG